MCSPVHALFLKYLEIIGLVSITDVSSKLIIVGWLVAALMDTELVGSGTEQGECC